MFYYMSDTHSITAGFISTAQHPEKVRPNKTVLSKKLNSKA